MVYGEEIQKAPQTDSYTVQFNDPMTIQEIEKITKGELSSVVNGRNPVSIPLPNEEQEKLREIYDSKRIPKDDTYRAPAIPRPQSLTISQGI